MQSRLYNGRHLFGMKLSIRLIAPDTSSRISKPVKRLGRGPTSIDGRRKDKATSIKNRRDGENHKGGKAPKISVTKKWLDAEMDSYLSGRAEGIEFWKKALAVNQPKLDDFIIIDSTD